MYLIIRCGSCRYFTYVDRYQQWKLCPHCGETINVRQAQAYLEVEDYTVAEKIISQLEAHLKRTNQKDLSPEEKESLRHQYAEWIRGQVYSYHFLPHRWQMRVTRRPQDRQ